jgi:hypothetical protein
MRRNVISKNNCFIVVVIYESAKLLKIFRKNRLIFKNRQAKNENSFNIVPPWSFSFPYFDSPFKRFRTFADNMYQP